MKGKNNSDSGVKAKEFLMSRKEICLRLIYTFIFLAVLGVVVNIIWLIAALQYAFLFATKNYIKPLRKFSASLTEYLKEIMDYILIISSKKPFPFSDFPKIKEPVEINPEEV